MNNCTILFLNNVRTLIFIFQAEKYSFVTTGLPVLFLFRRRRLREDISALIKSREGETPQAAG